MSSRDSAVTFKNDLLRVIQGILIGGGAILPGVSGGVLCVAFGIYRPMMELLANPKQNLPKYWRMFLPIVIGWLLGFVVFAGLIQIIFSASETLAVVLFIGLIAGTLPSLYRECGKEGHGAIGYGSMLIGFLVMFGILSWVKYTPSVQITPSAGWFLFAGILWGFSTIVPGMTSSSILIALGLFTPMVDGVTALEVRVILPLIAGIVIVVISFAKLIHVLFQSYYRIAFHIIFGFVIASTVIIIPLDFRGVTDIVARMAVFAVGFLAAWSMERFGPKTDEYADSATQSE